MSRYSITEGKFGEHQTVILEDSLEGSRAEIALRGATLISYQIKTRKRTVDIIDGYKTPQELIEQSGARSCIMAPFSNRIENGFYIFNDEQHQMINPVDPKREVIHGYARTINFKLQEQTAGEDKAEVILFSDYIRRGSFPGYPYCIDLTVRFTLSGKKLEVEIAGKNVGVDDTPFGCGWHPYFKTGETGVDHLILEVPARSFIEIDDRYLPLKGEAAYVSLENYPEISFPSANEKSKNIISGREINYCYTDLQANSDGLIKTSITDEQEGLKISVYQSEGVVYVYTGDELKYRPRRAIAIEPVQYITNSFNRPELRKSITLKQGDTKRFVFGVEHELKGKF